MEEKRFKSIHIDLEKGIYEVNGEKVERATKLDLSWAPEYGWELLLSVNQVYKEPY